VTTDREARLAAALRANLRKRKAQARGREDARANQPPGPADGRNPPEEARPAHRDDDASRKDP
jgi:hypothetical protein